MHDYCSELFYNIAWYSEPPLHPPKSLQIRSFHHQDINTICNLFVMYCHSSHCNPYRRYQIWFILNDGMYKWIDELNYYCTCVLSLECTIVHLDKIQLILILYCRILWLILCLGVFTLFLYLVFNQLVYLSKHPRSVDVEIIFSDGIQYPCVTLCNQNYFR